METEIDSIEFVQGVLFECTDSLKNNGTKYLLILCESKAFVDFASPGRHRELSTNYIRHNLFHQNKLG